MVTSMRILRPKRSGISRATRFLKRKCRFLNWKTRRASRYGHREQNPRSSITFARSADRRMENSILQNLLELRRKSEKSSIVSGIAYKRMPRRASAKTIGNDFRSLRQGYENNLKLQIPSSRYSKRRVILSEAKDLWHLSPALVTIIRDVSLRST